MKTQLIAGVVGIVLFIGAGVAWAAGPDTVALTNISTSPGSTQNGKNINVTGTINAGDSISLGFTVGASGAGTTSTTYPDTIHLTAPTNVKPAGASDVTVAGLSNCTLTGRSSTCSESATMTAPGTAGAYQVRLVGDDGRTGSGRMNQDFFFVNFTVVVPSGCTPAPTTLVFSTPDCLLYHAGSVSLSATLKSGDTPLVGKTITFYVDGNQVGTADTDSNGVATMTTYDPSALPVGDHALSAAWESDNACYMNPTVTGAVLGIKYLFLGFQPPINADGSTILTGKAGPVKIRIVDANAVPVSDATALVFFEDGIQQIVGTDPENATTALNFDYGNVMRYSDGQYVYNWNMSTVTNGTKTVSVFLGEGSCADAHLVTVSVGKKK